MLVVVVVPFVFAGTLAVIVVSAGPSTFHVNSTGVASKFPASSMARTSSLCWPASGLTSYLLSGAEAHSLHTGGSTPGSSAHSKLTPGSGLAKMKIDGRSTFCSAGGFSRMDVSGTPMSSMVHSQVAGTGSASRCSLSAVISSVCAPPAVPLASARSASVNVTGDSQNSGRPPSSEQSACASGSSTENVNVALASFVAGAGPVWIVICGGVTSPTSHS